MLGAPAPGDSFQQTEILDALCAMEAPGEEEDKESAEGEPEGAPRRWRPLRALKAAASRLTGRSRRGGPPGGGGEPQRLAPGRLLSISSHQLGRAAHGEGLEVEVVAEEGEAQVGAAAVALCFVACHAACAVHCGRVRLVLARLQDAECVLLTWPGLAAGGGSRRGPGRRPGGAAGRGGPAAEPL